MKVGKGRPVASAVKSADHASFGRSEMLSDCAIRPIQLCSRLARRSCTYGRSRLPSFPLQSFRGSGRSVPRKTRLLHVELLWVGNSTSKWFEFARRHHLRPSARHAGRHVSRSARWYASTSAAFVAVRLAACRCDKPVPERCLPAGDRLSRYPFEPAFVRSLEGTAASSGTLARSRCSCCGSAP